MAQPAGASASEASVTCKYCSRRIERRDKWWVHEQSGSARCHPGNPRSASLADPATPVMRPVIRRNTGGDR